MRVDNEQETALDGLPTKRRTAAPRSTWKSTFLLGAIAFTAVVIFFSAMPASGSEFHSLPNSPAIPPSGPHLRGSGRPDYCSAPTTGAEGYGKSAGERKLHAVAIVIRHGDRSAIHSVPNETGSPVRWRCVPSSHEYAAKREWPGLRSSFVVRRLRDGSILQRTLRPALLSSNGAPPGSSCAPGQLTPRGFEQHVRLGRHLSAAYAPLLDAISANRSSHAAAVGGIHKLAPPPALFVRSTDYARTLLSAAGLLLGLFHRHPSLRPSAARPVSLYTEDAEAEDYMHGVGLASSSKQQNGPSGGAAAEKQQQQQQQQPTAAQPLVAAESERSGKCADATKYAKRAMSAWKPTHPEAWRQIEALFGGPALVTMKTTGVADALFARTCHGLAPPCGSAGCVDTAAMHSIWSDAHSFYCERFGGPNGGERSSRLAMLPLLRDIFGRLQAASQETSSERISVFSGHDTVVAPLLAALGGMRAPMLCRWPPYASHITFEVWSRNGADGPSNGGATLEVRVLFNGEAVTRYLNGCDRSIDGAEGDFCPLNSLMAAVRQLEREFTATCGNVA